MNYTLHQLKIFLKVCEHQSITRAAEEMFLTQPAVSLQLKKLQDQFDIPLTEIIGRKLYVTDFGREIEQASLRILEESESIENAVKNFKGLLHGKIKISCVSTGKYVIPYFLSGFINEHPGVKISIDVTNRSKVLEELDANETDFALVSVMPSGVEVESIELMKNELFLFGANKEEEGSKIKGPKDLENLPLIFREEGSATRTAMESYLERHNINVKSGLELVSNEAVKQGVIAGLGYSILPQIGVRTELKVGSLKIIPLKGLPITTSWNLIHLKSKRLSPASEALLSHIDTHKSHVIQQYFSTTE